MAQPGMFADLMSPQLLDLLQKINRTGKMPVPQK